MTCSAPAPCRPARWSSTSTPSAPESFRGWLHDGDVVTLQGAGSGRDPPNRPQKPQRRNHCRHGPTRMPFPPPSGSTRRRRKSPTPAGCTRSADRVWAWTLPDGGYGWSNAGLVAGDGASLLVDTLFDLPLTREMLDRDGADHRPRADHRRADHPLQRRPHPRQPTAGPLGAGHRRQGHRRGDRPRHGARDAGDGSDRRPRSGRDAVPARTVRALRLQRHHAAQRRSDLRRRAHHRRRRPRSAIC